MTPEAAKHQSHTYLAQHAIPINEALPLLESPSELAPRPAEDVARRASILTHIIGIGFGQPGGKMKKPLADYGLIEFVSDNELRLLDAAAYTEQEKTNATWLVECLQTIGWCFKFVALDPFTGCDNDLASHFPDPFTDPEEFVASTALRPFPEIFQQADLHYRLHWAAVDCRLKGLSSPIQESIMKERRKALDWVIGVEANWDEIQLDT